MNTDEPKVKPKAKPKKPWIESLIGTEVILVDKYATKIEIEKEKVFKLLEVDSTNRLLIVEGGGFQFGVNMDMVKVISKAEYLKEN